MLRYLKSVLLSVTVLIALNSCEKELSKENGTNNINGTQSGTAVFTLDGAPLPCTSPLISGNYVISTPLDNTNSVIVNVNVISVGTYTISTALINGIQFIGSGTFTATGAQTITLFGAGTPLLALTSTYIPGTNGCSFSITVTTTLVTPVAVFTLDGAPNACTSPIINGIYAPGTALNSSNTVQLTANVTTGGTYSITTPVVSGFSFSGSGTLSTGSQVITLHGTGTPTAAGPAAFTPVAGSCSFTINVSASGGTSEFTYNGAPNACTSPVIGGTYTAGFPLVGSNIITVSVTVTTAGTYNITTNTVNGISFAASGTVAAGPQTIVLTGSGTPTAANTSSFTIGSNGCSFPITTVAPPPAVFTYGGGTGTCSPVSVDGSYNTGNALSGTTNTITIQVNVTTAGTYTISTNTVNGYSFSKTGVFTTTGIQSVTLAGSGTPAAIGTDLFTVTGGCTFQATVTAPISPCSGLTDGVFTMTGLFTLNGFSFAASLGTQFQVSIQDGAVTMNVFFPGPDAPLPGTYSIGSVTMHCLNSDFTDWNATSGSVYVGTDGIYTVVEFCNVSFHGVPLMGGSVNGTGAGKMMF